MINPCKVVFLMGLFAFAACRSFAQNAVNDELHFVVFPYLQDMTDSSVSIMWESSLSGKGQLFLAKADSHILIPELKPAAEEKTSGTMHHLCISGLKPDELYFYQAVNISAKGDTLRGPITRFTLPDYNQSAISFTVVGDNQGHTKCWQRLTELMAEECPSFIIHCGDMVAYGPNKDDWTDEFFKQAGELFSRVPFYPAVGNHEMNDEKYFRYFNLPYDDAFRTMKKGNLRIIFVDTNKEILEGSVLYRRLEQTLANCNEQWKIVVHHHPLFTSDMGSYRSSLGATGDKGDPNLFQLKKLYETYGVDLVLSGHVHGYERTFPIFKNHIDTHQGVVYIISAGGGGGFNPKPTYKEWFSQEIKMQDHFLNVRILGNILTVEAIDTSRVVFDSWSKEKKPDEIRLNAPLVDISPKYFMDSTTVTIQNPNDHGIINYRLNDGNFQTSFAKCEILKLGNTATVSALISVPGAAGREMTKTAIKLPLMGKQKKETPLKADYYEGFFTMLPDFNKLQPLKVFYPDSISIAAITPRAKDHFAIRFTGSFAVSETGVYRFSLESFDGSRLIIDGEEIINNDGVHYEIFREGYAALEKGIHTFELSYFDFERRETLRLMVGKENEKPVSINHYILQKRR